MAIFYTFDDFAVTEFCGGLIVISKGSIIKGTSFDDLRERIKVLYYDYSRDEIGDIVSRTEKTRYTCWAKILPYAAKDGHDVASKSAEIYYRIIIRYRKNIKPDDIIFWRSKKLQIVSPPYDAENRHLWLVIDCRELVEDGQTL